MTNAVFFMVLVPVLPIETTKSFHLDINIDSDSDSYSPLPSPEPRKEKRNKGIYPNFRDSQLFS